MGIFRRLFGRGKADGTTPPDQPPATDGAQPPGQTTRYILEEVRKRVWSGFCGPREVDQLIDDLLEGDADEAFLRAAVAPEFESKALAERSWPDTTDCDRLDQAFAEMNERGIVALQNTGYTMSDGLEDVYEGLYERGPAGVEGYCFYHFQDVEQALAGGGLYLAFGVFREDKAAAAEVGRLVRGVLESHGFRVDWDGNTDTRPLVSEFDWKRRLRA